jgi:hypothetical protein
MSSQVTTSEGSGHTAVTETKGKPEELLGEHYETAYSMVADENLGSRDLGDLPRKMAMEEELTEDNLTQMLEIAKERYLYLNDQKYFGLAQKLEQVIDSE